MKEIVLTNTANVLNERKHKSLPSPRFCWEGTIFEKGGSEKNDCLGGLKEFLP